MSESGAKSKRLLMVMTLDYFFLSHRRGIAEAALGAGWDVTLFAKDTGRRAEIEAMGIHFIASPIHPTGLNVLEELNLLHQLIALYKQYRDAIVHHVGLKNILWGGLAARIVGVRGVINAVCGLGVLYGQRGFKAGKYALNRILSIGSLAPNVRYIFQNHDDEALFRKAFNLKDKNIIYIKGSGVDLCDYIPSSRKKPVEKLRVIFVGRMIREKGVFDFIQAAELLRDKWKEKVEFVICGGLYPGPNSIGLNELSPLCDGKYIKWLGECDNIPEQMRQADVMAYPSYYREGVPKTLLEASAAGLPLVVYDSVGCRDTVDNNINGFKVKKQDIKEFASKIETLLENSALRERMGAESRQKAEREYDVRNVAARHLSLYEDLWTATKS